MFLICRGDKNPTLSVESHILVVLQQPAIGPKVMYRSSSVSVTKTKLSWCFLIRPAITQKDKSHCHDSHGRVLQLRVAQFQSGEPALQTPVHAYKHKSGVFVFAFFQSGPCSLLPSAAAWWEERTFIVLLLSCFLPAAVKKSDAGPLACWWRVASGGVQSGGCAEEKVTPETTKSHY